MLLPNLSKVKLYHVWTKLSLKNNSQLWPLISGQKCSGQLREITYPVHQEVQHERGPLKTYMTIPKETKIFFFQISSSNFEVKHFKSFKQNNFKKKKLEMNPNFRKFTVETFLHLQKIIAKRSMRNTNREYIIGSHGKRKLWEMKQFPMGTDECTILNPCCFPDIKTKYSTSALQHQR